MLTKFFCSPVFPNFNRSLVEMQLVPLHISFHGSTHYLPSFHFLPLQHKSAYSWGILKLPSQTHFIYQLRSPPLHTGNTQTVLFLGLFFQILSIGLIVKDNTHFCYFKVISWSNFHIVENGFSTSFAWLLSNFHLSGISTFHTID